MGTQHKAAATQGVAMSTTTTVLLFRPLCAALPLFSPPPLHITAAVLCCLPARGPGPPSQQRACVTSSSSVLFVRYRPTDHTQQHIQYASSVSQCCALILHPSHHPSLLPSLHPFSSASIQCLALTYYSWMCTLSSVGSGMAWHGMVVVVVVRWKKKKGGGIEEGEGPSHQQTALSCCHEKEK